MSNKNPVITIEKDLCKGCKLCVKNCPKHLITISDSFNRLGYQYAQVSSEGCTGCATCFYSCPEPGTITIKKTKTPSKQS